MPEISPTTPRHLGEENYSTDITHWVYDGEDTNHVSDLHAVWICGGLVMQHEGNLQTVVLGYGMSTPLFFNWWIMIPCSVSSCNPSTFQGETLPSLPLVQHCHFLCPAAIQIVSAWGGLGLFLQGSLIHTCIAYSYLVCPLQGAHKHAVLQCCAFYGSVTWIENQWFQSIRKNLGPEVTQVENHWFILHII